MNVLPKGIFTVVVATVIASVLILWSGNSVADSSKKEEAIKISKDEEIASDVSTNATSQVAVSSVQSEATTTKIESAPSSSIEVAKAIVGKKSTLPPPGPFQFADKKGTSQVAANAPTAPVKQTFDAALPNKPKMDGVIMQPPKLVAPKPKLGLSQPNMTNTGGVSPTLSSMPVKVAAPEFNMTIPSIPMANTSMPTTPEIKLIAPDFSRPNMNVQSFMPNMPTQPIWTQTPPTFSGGIPSFQGMAPQMPSQMQNGSNYGQTFIAPGFAAPSQKMPINTQGMNMMQGQQYMYMPAYPPRVYYPQMQIPRYNYPQNMNNFMPHEYQHQQQHGGNMKGMGYNNHHGMQNFPKKSTGVKTQ